MRRRYRDVVRAEFEELRWAAKVTRRIMKCRKARPEYTMAIIDNIMGGIHTMNIAGMEK